MRLLLIFFILSSFLLQAQSIKWMTFGEALKAQKKNPKKISLNYSEIIQEQLPFKLTNGQKKALSDINLDLQSAKRMFRIIQGDVGSGKTIVSLMAIINTIWYYWQYFV